MHPNVTENISNLSCHFFRAVGNKMYGNQYRQEILDSVRRAAEFCDCLQCFFIIHSMGGGKSIFTNFFKF